jgi:hypothetical protein
MYKTVIRTIPVLWLLEILNIGSMIFNFISAVFERITSFFTTNAWNLSGLDTYYVFIDENPIPIHYPKFLIGGIYDKLWFYNVRTREFTYGLDTDTRIEYLPALTAIYRSFTTNREFSTFDITGDLIRMTFRTYPGIFPTPMQLVGAWSLHSGIWPSMMQTKYKHVITMMNCQTAEDLDVSIGLKASKFDWNTFSEVEEEDTEAEEEDTEAEEEDTEAEEDNETITENEDLIKKIMETMDASCNVPTLEIAEEETVKEMVEESKASIEEMKEAVEEMVQKSREIHEEGQKIIKEIFEEMNKSCAAPSLEEAEEAVEEEHENIQKHLDEIAEELDSKYSLQAIEDKDIHVIQDSEYFEKVD